LSSSSSIALACSKTLFICLYSSVQIASIPLDFNDSDNFLSDSANSSLKSFRILFSSFSFFVSSDNDFLEF